MTMAVDNRQHNLLNGLSYHQAPQFTNPWVTTTAGASAQLYAGSLAPTSAGLENTSAQQQSMRLQYPGAATSPAPLGTDSLSVSRPYGTQYTAAQSPNTYAPATSAPFSMDYGNRATAGYGYSDPTRRPSHPSVPSESFLGLPDGHATKENPMIDMNGRLNDDAQRNRFTDALEASRGMVSMSQSDITPRNIFGNSGDRSSVSSYGFPSTHSSHSSISSASYNPSSYYGSVCDSSVTDYSSASESVDLNSRTLPRPSNLMGANLPPAPQSMMGQFSSKVASSSQKKHKCKICDKRFTRPSSLQTHMYSHTGEKPFACEVEGCGRHFSVVSNLRRHRKVHKNDGDHSDDHASPDE